MAEASVKQVELKVNEKDLLPIPQPKPHFLLKNAREIDAAAFTSSLKRLQAIHGPLYRLQFPGNTNILVVSSRELLDEICNDERFEKALAKSLVEIRAVAGDGLFTAYNEEPDWGKAHRILMPVFGPGAMRALFDEMADIAGQMMLRWERFGEHAVIDVAENMTRLTLDTIALCAFNYRFNSFYREELHPFINAMSEVLVECGLRPRRMALQNALMLQTKRRFNANVRFIHNLADELIAQRKLDPHAHERKDLLQLMLNGRDPVSQRGLSDENIRFQMVTFLIAGHETTSGLLSFALYLLLKNPEIMQKARSVVDEVLGTNEPHVEQLSQLSYLERIFKESLRLYPTAPAFARQALKDTTLGGRYAIHPNEILLVNLSAVHRDPLIWDDPERFNPDRFLPEAEASRPANSYKPFGSGMRSCIGRAFAMQEAVLVLAMLLQRFDVVMDNPAYELKIKQTLTIKPDGFHIRVSKRPSFVAAAAAAGAAAPAHTAAAAAAPVEPAAAAAAEAAGVGSSASADSALTPLMILYGSNSGSAQGFAQRVSSDARAHGFLPTLDTMDAGAGALPTKGAVLVISASYEGQPPDNARTFVSWVESLKAGELAGVKFGVFGCGNRDWVRTYQAVPKRVDVAMEAAGAVRIVPRGEADARTDFFGDFEHWYSALWAQLSTAFGMEVLTQAAGPSLSVQVVSETRAARLRQTELEPAVVTENRELVDMSSPFARSKRHIEMTLPAGMTYTAGDYLAVLPVNPAASVDRALARFGFDRESQVVVKHTTGSETTVPVGYPVLVAELLGSYVELAQPATRSQIKMLAGVTTNTTEQAALLALVADSAYEKEVLAKRVSVLDLLERAPSCALPFAAFLSILPPLRPRQYSISSSPLHNPHSCTLTVALLDAPALSGQGRFLGITSNYLAKAAVGTHLAVAVRASHAAFHPPESLETPLIMICAGTGIAPFRGFIQDRALRVRAAAATPGAAPPAPALLFFGCSHPDVDYMYKDELKQWAAEGVVDVRPAFSKMGAESRHVQARFWDDRADAIALFKRNARVYVCGDGKIVPELRAVTARMYQEEKACTIEEAQHWVAELEQNRARYYADLFA